MGVVWRIPVFPASLLAVMTMQCLFPKMLPSSLQLGDNFDHCIDAMAWLKLAALLCLVAEAESGNSVVGPAGAEHDRSPPQRARPPGAQAAPLASHQLLNPI